MKPVIPDYEWITYGEQVMNGTCCFIDGVEIFSIMKMSGIGFFFIDLFKNVLRLSLFVPYENGTFGVICVIFLALLLQRSDYFYNHEPLLLL